MEDQNTRSKTMRAVKAKDTSIELVVRRALHKLGYRYRIHGKSLPGCPDLVFASRRKVLFIHGCFWHGHACSRGNRPPKANASYWSNKISKNRQRDVITQQRLRLEGWKAITIWECDLKVTPEAQLKKIVAFLGQPKAGLHTFRL